MKLNPIKANQNEVQLGSITVLFSYKTPVAYMDHSVGVAYVTKKKWSSTTTRHINKWLVGYSADTINYVDQSVLDNLLNEVK